MSFVLYTILSFLVFLFCGIGLALLIAPKGLRKYVLHLSPIVGYCYLTLAGWHLSTFGQRVVFDKEGRITAVNSVSNHNFAGTDSYAFYLLVPPLLFLIAAVILRKEHVERLRASLKGFIAPLAIAFFSFILLSVPLISYKEPMTTVSIGNHDIIDCGLKSRFLKEFSLSDTTGYLSHLNEDGHSFLKHDVLTNRFGSPFAAAYLGSLFSLEAYKLQSLISHIFLMFGVLLFYALAREIFGYGEFPSAAVSVLYGLSPTLYYLVYQGFQPQIVAMGITMGFFLLHFRAANNSSSFNEYAPYIPLAALLNWGMSITYAHMLPIIYAPLAAYVVFTALRKKNLKGVLDWTLFQAAVFMLAIWFSVFRAKALLGNLRFHALLEAGWNMPYLFPDYLFGLDYIDVTEQLTAYGYTPFYKPLFAPGVNPSTGVLIFIHILLSAPLILAAAKGIYRKYKEDEKLFVLSATCLLTAFGGYNFIYFTASVSAQYKSFKLISFFLPLVILSALVLFNEIKFNFKKALPALLSVLVILNIVSAVLFLRHSFEGRYVDKELAGVKKVEEMKDVESVNILGYVWWDAMWENVFLMKKKQYFQTSLYSGRSTEGRIDGQWDLYKINNDAGGDCGDAPVVINDLYRMRKAYHIPDEAMKADINPLARFDDARVGYKVDIPVKVRNDGSSKWLSGCDNARKLYLSYVWYRVLPDGIHMKNMSGTPIDRTLNPGEETVISLSVKMPEEPGKYVFVLDMIQERVSWFRDKGSKPFVMEMEIR